MAAKGFAEVAEVAEAMLRETSAVGWGRRLIRETSPA